MKEIIATLTAESTKNGRPLELALSDWLDFLLEFHDVKYFTGDNYAPHVQKVYAEQRPYFDIMIQWLEKTARAMENGRWLDTFGTLYEEMYLSRGKASQTGQFFTPHSVSDLMAQIVNERRPETEHYRVNDCAAGSGRLLLAHFLQMENEQRNLGRRYYYVAQDSDPMACKMCALNMMVHGMQGKVICQNTLTLDTPKVVYHVNEVRYPIATPYYSIRAEYPEEVKKARQEQAEK